MARPPIRGSLWSLNQIRVEAGATRGFSRAAVADGWLPENSPYSESDIIVLRLAQYWIQMFPHHRSPTTSALASTARRLAASVASDPRSTSATTMIATEHNVVCPDTPDAIATAVSQTIGFVAVLFPVGAWVWQLPSRRTSLYNTPTGAFPSSQTHPPRPFPSQNVPKNVKNPPPVPLDPPLGNNSAPAVEEIRIPYPPKNPPMSAYQAFTLARDEIVAKVSATQTIPYDSPGEPW
jgi:hypothetical protein